MYPVAQLSRPLHQHYVQCLACEHWCALAPGEVGRCGVRRNHLGNLELMVFGSAIAVHVDPVEKKPLNHFLPGSHIFSLGTIGCNLSCAWCQNWEISQQRQPEFPPLEHGESWQPQDIVQYCLRRKIPLIAFTYNEPAIYMEYAHETARLAHGAGLRCVLVSSGFETLQALNLITPYLAAINVDLKAFRDETYRNYCGARLEPVKRNLRHLVRETAIWTEVTTLVIPGINDSESELRQIADFLVELSPDLPWHVSGFRPQYRMLDRPATPAATLHQAWEIGRAAGLRYVYTGNSWGVQELDGCSDTCCPGCGALVIERHGYAVRTHWTSPGVCPGCGQVLPGRWT